MKTLVRSLLVAFAFASFAGCAAEDLSAPEDTADTAAAAAPADEEPVAADESELNGRFFTCGGQACDRFTSYCCNNHCRPFRPGVICVPMNGEGSSE